MQPAGPSARDLAQENYKTHNAPYLRETKGGKGRGDKAVGEAATTPAQCDQDGAFSCIE